MFKYLICFSLDDDFIFKNEDLIRLGKFSLDLTFTPYEYGESGGKISFIVELSQPITLDDLVLYKKALFDTSKKIDCYAEYIGPSLNISEKI